MKNKKKTGYYKKNNKGAFGKCKYLKNKNIKRKKK
jgi:hypothetical protein